MKVDLLCLLADKNMEAAISGLLSRPKSLGIRRISYSSIVHPERDPGCFLRGPDFLRNLPSEAEHALIVLDHAWAGAPIDSGADMETELEARIASAGMEGWARAIVIEPELEAWVFANSSQVPTALGWHGTYSALRNALASQGLWRADLSKPSDPKAAMEWVLRNSRLARSSSVYRDLASRVGTKKCTDRAFVRFRDLLQNWFPD